MSEHHTLYEADFVAWADETAKLLREKEFSKLDLNALIEEVESLARVDRKAIWTQLERLLHDLLGDDSAAVASWKRLDGHHQPCSR